MDSDERPSHFAWDLLDKAEQIAIQPNMDQRVFGARSCQTTVQPAEVQALELPRDTALIAQSSPLIQPEPKVLSHEPSALPVRSEPVPHGLPFRADLEPKAGMLPHERSAAEARLPQPGSNKHPMTAKEPLRIRSDETIPRLCWSDIGMPTEPGQYSSRYGSIQVHEDEIWIWKLHPNATFVVLHPSPYSRQEFSQLGSFDLGIGHTAIK